MPNSPVSVIIPAYHSEKSIKEALDSVFNQTDRPIEVIVVDDGSTDKTAETVKKYPISKTGIDLIYIHQQNSGPSRARNTGIKASKGEYIAFLDADDLWMQDKLEKQLQIFKKDPDIDIVFTDVKITRVKNERVEEFSVFKKKGLDEKFFGHKFIVLNPLEKLIRLNFMPTPAVIVKKACFNGRNYFNEKRQYVEDWELWLEMSLHYKFGYVNDICVHVRDMGDGLSSDGLKMTLASLEVFDSFITSKKTEIDSLKLKSKPLTKCIKDEYKWMGYYLMKNKNNNLARSFYKKSLREALDIKTVLYYLSSFIR